jgi:membrane glycosyltransferase
MDARPLEMQAQNLACRDAASPPHDAPVREPVRPGIVRLVLAALTCAATASFSSGLYNALALHNGGTSLHYIFLVLSTLSFAWIAFGAANAVIGTYSLLLGTGGDSIVAEPSSARLTSQTALLFPVYGEDIVAIAENIRELARGLTERGIDGSFAFFILSDTQTDNDRAGEHEAFSSLADEIGDGIAVAYRNRRSNVGKKAENIADWTRTYGGGYDFFIIFDADSTMSIDTLTRLVTTMQAHPDTGLIQTVPRLVGGTTIFAWLQQFANNVFGPVGAAGLAAWQGASGNYWGHNAIIRTGAFAQSAGLPELPGAAPWGGHIRSHDFVEAALLRRAGWRIALLTSLDGTFEQGPPTIIEFAIRDRRWMQGNLQHARVVSADGFTLVSRTHLVMGILTYVSSAIWLFVIVIGLCLTWLEQQRVVSYFDRTKSLFPNWPTFDPAIALQLLGATVVVVLMPKLLGLGLALGRLPRDRTFLLRGGWLLAQWIAEVVHGALMAPVSMLAQSKALIELLLKRDSGWAAQRRASAGVPLKEAARFHRLHVITGLVLGGAAAMLSWHALAWLTPVVLGLVLSPVVTWATSNPMSPNARAPNSSDNARVGSLVH